MLKPQCIAVHSGYVPRGCPINTGSATNEVKSAQLYSYIGPIGDLISLVGDPVLMVCNLQLKVKVLWLQTGFRFFVIPSAEKSPGKVFDFLRSSGNRGVFGYFWRAEFWRVGVAGGCLSTPSSTDSTCSWDNIVRVSNILVLWEFCGKLSLFMF